MYALAMAERDGRDGTTQSEDPPFPRCIEDAPLLLTRLVLEAYARYCAQHAPGTMHAVTTSTDVPPVVEEGREAGSDVVSASSSGAATSVGGDAGAVSVTSVEDMLLPLEVLYGKTFIAAVGIALHGAEPILRYVEQGESEGRASTAQTNVAPRDNRQLLHECGGNGVNGDARCFYRVGQYTLLSPHYCPCTAYAYQCVRRKELWCCKHILALQLVLALEAAGVPPENLHTRCLDRQSFHNTLMEAV